MKYCYTTSAMAVFALFMFALLPAHAQQADPLPSWADGASKQAIVDFVQAVTEEGGKDYVAPAERIATFDNDGTLWVEYPLYTQLVFAVDRVKSLAPHHPEWKIKQPFKALLEGDMKAVAASGMKGLMEIVLASHSGMSATAFEQEAAKWLATAKHPKLDRLYAKLVYQPQLELLEYLRANGFKTFIVSGGGVAFMRPITQKAYGIPPEQVIGSRVVSEYQNMNGKPAIVRMPKIGFIDDKAGKPVAIYEQIGRRPILAFGNSDGDFEMVEYTTAGEGRRLGLFVHHTDGEREFAYDRKSHVGKLDKALDQASARGWIIVDMKQDWKTVFPQ
jgi:phosphoserine phosphatase